MESQNQKTEYRYYEILRPHPEMKQFKRFFKKKRWFDNYQIAELKGHSLRKYQVQPQNLYELLQFCQWRYVNHLSIVKVLFAQIYSQRNISHEGNLKVNLYIENIELVLSNLNKITLPEALFILKSSILGYEKLSKKIFIERIDEKTIGFNSLGECKVWVSTHYEKYSAARSIKVNENDIIWRIISVISNHRSTFLQQFFCTKISSILTFVQIKKQIQIFLRKNKINIPVDLKYLVDQHKCQEKAKQLKNNYKNIPSNMQILDFKNDQKENVSINLNKSNCKIEVSNQPLTSKDKQTLSNQLQTNYLRSQIQNKDKYQKKEKQMWISKRKINIKFETIKKFKENQNIASKASFEQTKRQLSKKSYEGKSHLRSNSFTCYQNQQNCFTQINKQTNLKQKENFSQKIRQTIDCKSQSIYIPHLGQDKIAKLRLKFEAQSQNSFGQSKSISTIKKIRKYSQQNHLNCDYFRENPHQTKTFVQTPLQSSQPTFKILPECEQFQKDQSYSPNYESLEINSFENFDNGTSRFYEGKNCIQNLSFDDGEHKLNTSIVQGRDVNNYLSDIKLEKLQRITKQLTVSLISEE